MPQSAPASRSLFFAFATLSAVLAYGLLDHVPTATEMRYAEGKVVMAEWQGMRRPRFVIRLDKDLRAFQVQMPTSADRSLYAAIAVGSSARIGHTSSTAGVSDRLEVFSLTVDGREIYTLDQLAAEMRKNDRQVFFYFFIPSTIGSLVCLVHWRRRAARVA